MTQPRISAHEHRQRIEKLQRQIQRCDLDLFVVSSFESIFYLTGAGFEPLERPFFLLVPPEGAPKLLVPKLDQQHMTKAHGIDRQEILTYREYPSPSVSGWPARLRELLSNHRQIGIEPTVRREITDQLVEFSLRTEPLVERQRRVKSGSEIEMIRRAAKYADVGVDRLLRASYFGATVAEGFAQTRNVTAKIIREVDDWDPLTTSVLMATWAAPRSAMPHSVPCLDDPLADGPHVALVLTRVNGYSAESERTYFTSAPSSDARNAFAAMTAARELAFGMVRPGVSCGELDARLNEFLCREGYGAADQRLHRTGHGIGLGTHEAPWLAEGSDDRLAKDMVISIEPGIYLDGVGGIRHSDTVLVTETGYELLTHAPISLDSLVLRNWNLSARAQGWLIKNRLGLKGSRSTDRTQVANGPVVANG